MKKIFTSVYTLTFILCVTTFINTTYAQASEDLVGTWNMDFQKMKSSSNFTSGFDYNKLPAESKANLKEAFESRTFTFNDDQTVSVVFTVRGNSRQADGTWSYEASNNRLAILINGKEVEYDISQQGNTLTMTPLVLEDNAVFKSLSLTKN